MVYLVSAYAVAVAGLWAFWAFTGVKRRRIRAELEWLQELDVTQDGAGTAHGAES